MKTGPYEMYFVAARPYPEKALDDKFYADESEAIRHCNKQKQKGLHFFKCVVITQKDPVHNMI